MMTWAQQNDVLSVYDMGRLLLGCSTHEISGGSSLRHCPKLNLTWRRSMPSTEAQIVHQVQLYPASTAPGVHKYALKYKSTCTHVPSFNRTWCTEATLGAVGVGQLGLDGVHARTHAADAFAKACMCIQTGIGQHIYQGARKIAGLGRGAC